MSDSFNSISNENPLTVDSKSISSLVASSHNYAIKNVNQWNPYMLSPQLLKKLREKSKALEILPKSSEVGIYFNRNRPSWAVTHWEGKVRKYRHFFIPDMSYETIQIVLKAAIKLRDLIYSSKKQCLNLPQPALGRYGALYNEDVKIEKESKSSNSNELFSNTYDSKIVPLCNISNEPFQNKVPAYSDNILNNVSDISNQLNYNFSDFFVSNSNLLCSPEDNYQSQLIESNMNNNFNNQQSFPNIMSQNDYLKYFSNSNNVSIFFDYNFSNGPNLQRLPQNYNLPILLPNNNFQLNMSKDNAFPYAFNNNEFTNINNYTFNNSVLQTYDNIPHIKNEANQFIQLNNNFNISNMRFDIINNYNNNSQIGNYSKDYFTEGQQITTSVPLNYNFTNSNFLQSDFSEQEQHLTNLFNSSDTPPFKNNIQKRKDYNSKVKSSNKSRKTIKQDTINTSDPNLANFPNYYKHNSIPRDCTA